MTQGLSPGWGDTYDYWRFEQWVDLGQTTLANGQYVLRSVTDPQNKIYESANKADAAREGIVDNEGITVLTVQNGTILDATKPSGTVTINDVDASTASKNVTVKVIGRDDVSGVDQFRLSNDGQTWSSPINYTSTGSTSTSVSWDITNPAYGGTATGGTKTVYAQFHDRDRQVVGQRVRHDHLQRRRRGRHLRLLQRRARGLPGGLLAAGRGRRHHRRRLGRGQPGHLHQQPAAGRGRLVASDAANKAMRLDGVSQHARVANSGSLSPTAQVSVDAWIKPDGLPATGQLRDRGQQARGLRAAVQRAAAGVHDHAGRRPQARPGARRCDPGGVHLPRGRHL